MSPRTGVTAQLRWEVVLGALGLWSIAVPYVSTALGMHLNVARKLEVADHVVPGIAIAASVALLLVAQRSAHPSAFVAPAALGIAFLAGLWITTTHVPLIFQAADHKPGAPWDTSIFHSLWGPPIAAISLWLLWRELAP